MVTIAISSRATAYEASFQLAGSRTEKSLLLFMAGRRARTSLKCYRFFSDRKFFQIALVKFLGAGRTAADGTDVVSVFTRRPAYDEIAVIRGVRFPVVSIPAGGVVGFRASLLS